MRRNGFAEARNPILKPLDTIECRDAILTADNAEPEWPAADVVIGLRQGDAGRARGNELHPGRCEPAGAAGGDR